MQLLLRLREEGILAPHCLCSDPDLWMQLNHHDDSPVEAEVSQHGSSIARASSTMDLELRLLTLLDARVGFAINALQDGEEVSIAVKESMYILRVAYFHFREHQTHNDEVEDIIEIYESDETPNYHARRNFALQWVMATRGRCNLTMDLELRLLTLLDARVGFAINALQDGEEVSIAVKESMYILRVAYFHFREHQTHNDEVEDIIEIYESDETPNYHARRNFALQWVMATRGRCNLNSGATMTEELKMIMDCLIHRLNQQFNLPRKNY